MRIATSSGGSVTEITSAFPLLHIKNIFQPYFHGIVNCLFVCLFIYLFIYLFILSRAKTSLVYNYPHLDTVTILSIYLSINLSIYLSIYLYIFISIHISIYLSIYGSIYRSIHLSISI